MANVPTHMDMLLHILQAQGMVSVAPGDRSNLHPLAIPLAASEEGNGEVICMLRWPEGHRGMELPIVRMARGGRAVRLLARSVEEYCHRALAEEDFAREVSETSKGPLASAAGQEGESLYEPGAIARSGECIRQ